MPMEAQQNLAEIEATIDNRPFDTWEAPDAPSLSPLRQFIAFWRDAFADSDG